MDKIFNLDNPVWRFVGKLADVFFLNIIWFIFSIPIFTIGASTTALYYVTMKIVQDTEGTSVLKAFWKSFKLNFKQSTVIWLICMVLAVVLGLDVYYYWNMETKFGSAVAAVFLILAIVLILAMQYVFPLQARFDNPIKRTMMFAVLLPLRYIWFTIPMILIEVAMLVAIYFYFPMILFGMGLVAFLNSYMLVRIFDKYTTTGNEEEIAEPEDVHVVISENDSILQASTAFSRSSIAERAAFTAANYDSSRADDSEVTDNTFDTDRNPDEADHISDTDQVSDSDRSGF